MGLKDLNEVEITSAIMGVNVTTTQSHVAKLLHMDKIGRFALNTKDSSPESGVIKQQLFLKYEECGNVQNMHIEYRLLFRILIGCFTPREGSTDQIS